MKRAAAVFGFASYAALLLLRDRNLSAYPAAAVVSAVLFAVAVFLYFIRRRHTAALLVAMTISAAVFLSSGAYVLKYALVYQPATQLVCDDAAELSGFVTEAQTMENYYRYTLREQDTGLKIRLTSENDLDLRPCDFLKVKAQSVYLPGREENRSYYMSRGVYLGGNALGCLRVRRGVSRNVFDRLALLRYRFCERIVEATDRTGGGLLCGIVFGDTGYLPQRVKNAFSAAGISHIFAVSGFHVSMWAGLVYFLIRLLRVKKKFAFLLPSAFAALYCAVTGFPPSAVRAAIMAVIVFSGNSFRLKSDLLNSLGAALSLITLAEPFSGGSTSLLLSVGAMLGVIFFSEYLFPAVRAGTLRCLGRRVPTKLLLWPVSVLLLSITITAVMAPLMLTAFGSVSVAAPLANLLVVPLAQIALPVGGLSVLAGFIPGIRFAAAVCGVMISWTDRIARTFSMRAGFNLPVYLAVLIASAALWLLLQRFTRRRAPRGAVLLSAFLACFCLSIFTSAEKFDKIKVTATPGGKSEVLIMYKDFSMLCCAGSPSYAASSMLSEKGVYDLDLLYLPKGKSQGRIKETYCPRAAATNVDAVTVRGDGLEVRVAGNLVLLRADGKTVSFSLNGGKAPADADVLFLPRDAEIPETDGIVVLPGTGENKGNIYYSGNGFDLILRG